MNKCPQCLNTLGKNVEVCSICNFSVVADVAETPAMFGVDETRATEILSDKEMTPEKWQKIKDLFEAAQEVSPDKREIFLRNACGADEELKHELEKLLGSFDDAASFMENPAFAEAASLFANKETLHANQTTGEIVSGGFVAGTILGNRYRIIGLLGKGGMGEVFRAEDLKLKQQVALKFLPENLEKNEAALNRFVGEVRTARQVSHVNVCRVFDIGETNGKHFLSMEFIDGDDLSSLLRRIGRLPSDKAAEISRQICFGLHAIHDVGILHRDLKPANIIIDSKGKARITDFGIAGLEEDILREEIRVGTPAYMSPEQIIGGKVTKKSDIYSLGLLLYEIFTGKQAFQADSINDLIEKHRSETPTNPSTFVENINPIVEKVINRCLEKDANDRPKSALQVALALPGGNPLEAAIAAGETPSPEMVAAAPKKGALKPKIALACLAAIVGLFVFIVAFSGAVKMHEWIPMNKSPEVLAERADSIVKNLGYTSAAVDIDYGFADTSDYLDYAEQTDTSSNRWEKIRSGQPVAAYFWYRQSPRYLIPLADVSVLSNDPPNDVSEMKRVILDPLGRLIEFQAVPAQVDEKSVQTEEIDWSNIFAEADLDIENFQKTESQWTPPVFSDERAAWEGRHVDHPEFPVRVEAASYRGKPVYFQVVAPWDKPVRQEETFASTPVKAAGVILTIAFFSILIAGIFLARYNLQRGRSDTKGAFKVALFVLVLSVAANLLVADHVPVLVGELFIFFKTVSFSLFNAALVWLIYIALEPYARRRWADLIISWNRLLAGDFRDPLIGRDILIGGLLGLCHTAAIYSMVLLPQFLNIIVPPNSGGRSLHFQGFKYLFADFLLTLVNSVFTSLGALFFLVLLIMILRKERLAIAAFWLINFAVLGLAFASTGPLIFWLAPLLIATITVICIARFGLLATISFYVFFNLSFHNPVSSDVSSFYFGNTVFALFVILGLAIYGFYISTAGQPIFKGNVLNEMD